MSVDNLLTKNFCRAVCYYATYLLYLCILRVYLVTTYHNKPPGGANMMTNLERKKIKYLLRDVSCGICDEYSDYNVLVNLQSEICNHRVYLENEDIRFSNIKKLTNVDLSQTVSFKQGYRTLQDMIGSV